MKQPLTIHEVPVWKVTDCLHGPPTCEPFFIMIFYNRSDLYTIAEGKENPIRAALKRRGANPDDFWTTFWAIEQVH